MQKLTLYSALIFGALIQNVNAAGFEILAPHRAVYDVKLKSSQDRSGIRAMDGRIVYEVNGNECDGITVKYRFVTNIRTAGELFVTDQRSTTFESPDGREFSFKSNNFVNDQRDISVQGNATSDGKETVVKLTKPDEKDLSLDPAKFVTTQLVEVISKARAGEQFYQTDVFDGSGSADEVVASTSIIGKLKSEIGKLQGEDKDIEKTLGGVDAWPVSISYFKKGIGNTAESLPIYEAAFLLHANGVTRDLTMRYPDYSLIASLKDLEILEKSPCK